MTRKSKTSLSKELLLRNQKIHTLMNTTESRATTTTHKTMFMQNQNQRKEQPHFKLLNTTRAPEQFVPREQKSKSTTRVPSQMDEFSIQASKEDSHQSLLQELAKLSKGGMKELLSSKRVKRPNLFVHQSTLMAHVEQVERFLPMPPYTSKLNLWTGKNETIHIRLT